MKAQRKLKTIRAINVVELLAEGEGEATLLGIRTFPDTPEGMRDAKALFKELVRENDADDADTEYALTTKQVNDFAKRGEYANGSYIAKIYASR